jgi:hypothetical protein
VYSSLIRCENKNSNCKLTNLQLHGLFHSSGCKNYNIKKFTTYFTIWACSKDPKSLHTSFYDMSYSSVKNVVKHIVISSFYNVVTVHTSLVHVNLL